MTSVFFNLNKLDSLTKDCINIVTYIFDSLRYTFDKELEHVQVPLDITQQDTVFMRAIVKNQTPFPHCLL